MGMVVNEAMASRLPVLLSSSCGCHPDLIEEKVTGFSFDPADSNELAKKMIAITSCDRQEMGEASYQRINHYFPSSKFGEGLANAIDSVVKR